MPRTSISSDYRNSAEAPYSPEYDLIFVTLEHADLASPVMIVNDASLPGGRPIEYHRDADVFVGCGFRLTYLTDDDGFPKGRIEIPNIDTAERDLATAIDSITTSPTVTIEVVAGSLFERQSPPDDHVWAASGVTPEITASGLRLENIQVDAMIISADIVSFNYGSEPWGIRATKGRFPGLYD